MPMPFNDAVMTNNGAALLTKAQAGECSITFTRMAIGNGEYTEDEKTIAALQPMTNLKSAKNSYTLNDCVIDNDYSVKVSALLTNQDPVTKETLVSEGYYINEIALFAKEKDGASSTEIMYSIAVTSGERGDFMPAYDGYDPTEIEQDYYATVNNSLTVTIDITGAALTVEQANEMKEEVDERLDGYDTDIEGIDKRLDGHDTDIEEIDTRLDDHDTAIEDFDEIAGDQYDGRDLTVVFADEIAQYSDEWAWIKARIDAGNFKGLRNCDYIPLVFDGYTYSMQINIDPYYRFTSSTIGHHIDFISKEVIPDTVQWNLENNNNGNEESAYPYMVSNLKAWLDEEAEKLPSNVKSLVTSKIQNLEQRYSASGTLTDSTNWGAVDMGLLWVPNEFEVVGSIIWGTPGWTEGYAVQYPVFKNTRFRIKCTPGSTSKRTWWLACVRSGSSANALYVTNSGNVNTSTASTEYRVPLCFRIEAG